MDRALASPPEVLLKRGTKRTVLRSGQGTVVKRFHAPGLLDACKDPLRALREARMLRRLRARGVAAPAPVGVRRRAGCWELELEEVEGAVDLAALLARRPLHRRELQGLLELGLALCRAGHRPADLHPGNVLLDPGGRAWLVDVGRDGLGRPLSIRQVERLLLESGSRLRESLGERARGWLATRLVQRLGMELDPAALEAELRGLRREQGARRDARWTRESGSCAPRGAGWRHREPADGRWLRSPALELQEAEAWWTSLGRLEEHGLPAARPVLLRRASADRGTSARLVVSIPTAGVLVDEHQTRPARDGLPGLDPTALGHLLGELHDRDLEWHPEAPLWLARELDGSLLVVRASLRPASMAGLRAALDLARLDEREPAGTHAFAEAYAARHRGGAADRRRARARAEEALS